MMVFFRRCLRRTTMHAQLALYFTACYGSLLYRADDFALDAHNQIAFRAIGASAPFGRFVSYWLLAFRNRRACDKKKNIITQRPPQSYYGTPQRPHAHPQSPNPACDRAAKKPAVKRSAAGRACCVRWWASRVPV